MVTVIIGVGCFVAGLMAHAALAQSKRPTWTPDLVQGKSAQAAAAGYLVTLHPSAFVPEMQIVPRLEPNFPR